MSVAGLHLPVLERMVSVIITILIACALVLVAQRVMRWQASRVCERVLVGAGDAADKCANLDPESRYVVRITTEDVVCERPDGKVERVMWDELQRVDLLNTGDGPFAPDVFWVLHGTDSGCVIPWGATGGSELLERLQQLSGFDNAAVIGAAGTTRDEVRVCWERVGAS